MTLFLLLINISLKLFLPKEISIKIQPNIANKVSLLEFNIVSLLLFPPIQKVKYL